MTRTFRAYFLNRALREKLLIVAILGIAVVMWASAFSSRATRLVRAVNQSSTELKAQQEMLDQKGSIIAAMEKATAEMEPARTLDRNELMVAARQYAQEAGISTNTSPLPELSSGRFAIHTVSVDLQNVGWTGFVNFYRKLESRHPYIVLSEMTLNGVGGSTTNVRGQVRIQSFEIKEAEAGAAPASR